jgi:uncharacterized protein YrrD
MIHATDLRERAVVDLGTGARIGCVDELVVDPAGRRIAGLIVTSGRGLLGRGPRRTIPASALHALGGDAITVRVAAATDAAIESVADLPLLAHVVGRKVLTQSGHLLGTIEDVLVLPPEGQIVGYSLASPTAGGLAALLDAGRRDARRYVRADADLLVGRDVVVVPDDAVADGEPTPDEAAPLDRDAPIHQDAPLASGRVVRPMPSQPVEAGPADDGQPSLDETARTGHLRPG